MKIHNILSNTILSSKFFSKVDIKTSKGADVNSHQKSQRCKVHDARRLYFDILS